MIREEFLECAARQNLFGLRMLRDIAVTLQTQSKVGEIQLLLKLERVKILSQSALEKATNLCKGFVSGIKIDNEFLTENTKNCEQLMLLLGANIDSRISDICAQQFKSSVIVPVGERGTIFDEFLKISESAAQYADVVAKIIQEILARQSQGKTVGYSETLLDCFGQIATDYQAVCARLAKKENASMLAREDILLKLKITLSESVDYSNIALRQWLVANTDSPLVLKRLASAAAGGVIKGIFAPITYDLSYRYCLLRKNV